MLVSVHINSGSGLSEHRAIASPVPAHICAHQNHSLSESRLSLYSQFFEFIIFIQPHSIISAICFLIPPVYLSPLNDEVVLADIFSLNTLPYPIIIVSDESLSYGFQCTIKKIIQIIQNILIY